MTTYTQPGPINPSRSRTGASSKAHLENLRDLLEAPLPLDFDSASISWVLDRIGITDKDGVSEALKAGHFVINVADEIVNSAQAKVVIEPYRGDVRSQLSSQPKVT
jgi:hypothetical protein